MTMEQIGKSMECSNCELIVEIPTFCWSVGHLLCKDCATLEPMPKDKGFFCPVKDCRIDGERSPVVEMPGFSLYNELHRYSFFKCIHCQLVLNGRDVAGHKKNCQFNRPISGCPASSNFEKMLTEPKFMEHPSVDGTDDEFCDSKEEPEPKESSDILQGSAAKEKHWWTGVYNFAKKYWWLIMGILFGFLAIGFFMFSKM